MPCRPIIDAAGHQIGWACSRDQRQPRCAVCGAPSTKLCDQPLTGPKAGKTCDRPLCARCAVHVGPDRDLCPAHARLEKGAA